MDAMQQQAGQFTPDQLIVAGRRAEAQGQASYAVQFYRYIADQYPSTTEAYEARDALYRLTQPVTGPPDQGYTAPPVLAQPTYAQPTYTQAAPEARPSPSLDVGHGPSHGQPVQAAPARKAAKAKKARAEPEADADQAFAGAAPGYRIGRLVAAMLGTMGWLLLISGVVMGPVIFAALSVKSMPKGLKEAIASNLLSVGVGTFGAIFLGLFAIFAAQVARASFDTADAVRLLIDAQNRHSDGS
jgi:hypothetical protein